MTTQEILRAAKAAAKSLLFAGSEKKNEALLAMADGVERHAAAVLRANAEDLQAARGSISEVMLDRLALNEARIRGMAEGIREAAALPTPWEGYSSGCSAPTAW
jgi:glutamate-5-semialdehyde dehydrogenase